MKLKQYEKFEALKQAVMRDSPNDVADMLGEFGELEFTAMALGLACRYRGLDMVRALVDGGAKFTYDLEAIKPLYKRAKLDIEILYPDENYAAALLSSINIAEMRFINTAGKAYNRPVLPINDRLRILSYLYKTADKTGFDGDELLFYAYFSGDREIIDFLKKRGAVVPERWVKIVTEGSTDDKWLSYCGLVDRLSDENFMPFMSKLLSEIGGRKLHMTDLFWHVNEKRLNIPGYGKLLLENFDLSKMNKGNLMKEIILRDDAASLEIAANCGWLKQPKKRDEMIAFAAENGKTECTAFLLDFKNRTADLAAERERAEKRQQRELNEAPDSIAAMKRIWKWDKRPDGTLVITGYKGDKTEVIVPEKIGGDTVTAIGEYAFSPDAKRILQAQRETRQAITKITLPDTITQIGEYAFSKCKSLCVFDIPPRITEIPKGMFDLSGISLIEIGGNIKKIGTGAFYWCKDLKTAVLREGVEEIESWAFYHCDILEMVELPRSITKIFSDDPRNSFEGCCNLTITLYKDSYSERFCADNKIPFKYKEE